MGAAAIGSAPRLSGATAAEAPATAPSLHALGWADARPDLPHRSVVARHLQRCYRGLLQAGEARGLAPIECWAVALRVAALAGCSPLEGVCRRRLLGLGAGHETTAAAAAVGTPSEALPSRLAAILAFVDAVADEPRRLGRSGTRRLRAEGLSIEGIAALS